MKFRFTIRDWLWLILVANLALCWHADHKNMERACENIAKTDQEHSETLRNGFLETSSKLSEANAELEMLRSAQNNPSS
jgi:hypothetical protein